MGIKGEGEKRKEILPELTSAQLSKGSTTKCKHQRRGEHVTGKDDKRHSKDRAKSTHIIIWTTSPSSPTHIEKDTEQWNLRNIGPRLYKVENEVDSLCSGPSRVNLRWRCILTQSTFTVSTSFRLSLIIIPFACALVERTRE